MTYKLVDSGVGEKLEQFGEVLVRRPDPEAIWPKLNEENFWKEANLTFNRIDSKTGKWTKNGNVPAEWQIEHGGINFILRPTSFKHLGIFPEQIENWEYISSAIKKRQENSPEEKIQVLNLFAYTGGATIAIAKAGAEVTHVDASKQVVEWAKENAKINNLSDSAVRWIVDDAMAFAKRELKRGKKYDAIVMDPPAFGRGPDAQVWDISENFLELFDICQELLSPKPLFFVISGYASGYSAKAFGNCLIKIQEKFDGKIETIELLLKESSPRNVSLPAGVTARWSK